MDAPNDTSSGRAARTEAREEVAQQLHDDVSQILSATAYLAAMLKKDLESRAAPEAERAGEIFANIRETSLKVRELMASLRGSSD